MPTADDTIRILTTHEMEEFERSNMIRTLESCGWRISDESGAGQAAGIPSTTLSSRMKVLKIGRPAA
jgi:transcriptional regulator of acetoin/glycerol metabolism